MENLRHYFEVQHGLRFSEAEYEKILDMAKKDIAESNVRETGATPNLDWLLNLFHFRKKKPKVNLSRYSKLEQEYS
jgi:hypothetical protein